MKKGIWIGVTLLGLIVAVAQKATERRFPRGILIPVSHAQMQLYNVGTEPLYYHGFTKNDTMFKIDIAPFPPKPADGEGVCGDGLALHELKPGNSIMLRAYLPHAAYAGNEVVVSCNLFGPLSGWEQFKKRIRERRGDSPDSSPPEANRPIVNVKTEKFLPKKPEPR